MKKIILISGLILFIFPSILVAGVDDSDITVLSTDGHEIIVELKVPEFKVQEKTQEEILYHQVSLPGFGLTQEIGRPQVPVRGALIGVPSTGGLTLEILDVSSQLLSEYHLYPAPRPILEPKLGTIRQEFAIDPETYGTDDFYPEAIVKVGFSGYMRDQRVVQLLFYPVQFNPVRDKMRVYQTIRVKVSFEGIFPSRMAKPFAGMAKPQLPVLNPYEKLLKDILLNYSSLARGE